MEVITITIKRPSPETIQQLGMLIDSANQSNVQRAVHNTEYLILRLLKKAPRTLRELRQYTGHPAEYVQAAVDQLVANGQIRSEIRGRTTQYTLR